MDDDDDDEFSVPGQERKGSGASVEMTPSQMPFTPRTQAFHTLDRKLPLQKYA